MVVGCARLGGKWRGASAFRRMSSRRRRRAASATMSSAAMRRNVIESVSGTSRFPGGRRVQRRPRRGLRRSRGPMRRPWVGGGVRAHPRWRSLLCGSATWQKRGRARSPSSRGVRSGPLLSLHGRPRAVDEIAGVGMGAAIVS
eukprot:6052130-Pyramimonas_sp.AAC.1